MLEKFTDPTIYRKQDEPPPQGQPIEQVESDNESPEETTGKKVVDERFHPHPELPEEIPVDIKEIFSSSVSGVR